MQRSSRTLLFASATAIACAAGLPAAAFGQAGDRQDANRPAQPEHTPPAQPQQRQGQQPIQPGQRPMQDGLTQRNQMEQLKLATLATIVGADVNNASTKDPVGSINDLILSRSTGRVIYAVLETGDFLGMGGRDVAIPFESLQWDELDEEFSLNMTREQLETQPEFTPETWTNLGRDRSALREWLDRQFTTEREGAGGDAVAMEGAKDVNGKIVGVERTMSGPHGEDVIVVLRTQDGDETRILMGPAWYVMGSPASPRRDLDASFNVVRSSNDVAPWVATRAEINNQRLQLRGEKGEPSWGGNTPESQRTMQTGSVQQYLLASDVEEADLRCRAESCGEVEEVILDLNSGRAVLLSIDPDENFLGIGDTERLIPWSIVTFGFDGTIDVDATAAMVTAAPEVPDDWNTYRDHRSLNQVYTAYGVQAPQYRSGFDQGDPRLHQEMQRQGTDPYDPARRDSDVNRTPTTQDQNRDNQRPSNRPN